MLTIDQPITCANSDLSASAAEASIRVAPLSRSESDADWIALFHCDPFANPVQHPEYISAELDSLPADIRQQTMLVRLESDRQLIGLGILIPKSVRTRQVGGIGPGWTIRGYRLAGGTFLTVDDSIDVQTRLLTAAVQQCIDAGNAFLLIEDLDEQSALQRAVRHESARGCACFAARETQPRWRIEFPDQEEDYWKTFSGRTRRAFRTRLKKFGETRLQRITNPQQIDDFLSAAHEISRQSWQSRQFGLRIRNDECERHCLSTLAALGFLRSYLWYAENQPVAFAVATQHAGHFRYEEIAYCSQFSSLSPGETMLQQIVEDLYRHEPPCQFDFGGGDAEYKRRFGNQESHSQSVWLLPSTWRAQLTLSYLNGCRQLRRAARTAVNACGFATKARQWLRYGGRSAHKKLDASKNAESGEGSATADESKGCS